MKHTVIAAILGTLLLAGCSVTAVPMATSAGTINLADNSLTLEKGSLTVTTRVRDLEYAPYRMVDNITSFEVTIYNRGTETVKVSLDSFILVDDRGQQYKPVSPEEVREIVRNDSPYLIPYPYVGYYYLEDSEQGSFFNTFTSSLPYYAENHPQDIFTEALPTSETILPGANISGLIYIVIDLTTKKSVDLRLYLPGTTGSMKPDFAFPFSIEK